MFYAAFSSRRNYYHFSLHGINYIRCIIYRTILFRKCKIGPPIIIIIIHFTNLIMTTFSPLDSEFDDLETPPRYRPESVQYFCRTTGFTESEIKKIYRNFKTECPTGLIKEDAFRGIYSQFFPQGGNIRRKSPNVFIPQLSLIPCLLFYRSQHKSIRSLCLSIVGPRKKRNSKL